jgi:hypothetical protein
MAKQSPIRAKETAALEATLTRELGAVIGGGKLTRALGYPSQAAFRQAVARDRLPIRMFEIDGRRGKFALARDIARWLHVAAVIRKKAHKKGLHNHQRGAAIAVK